MVPFNMGGCGGGAAISVPGMGALPTGGFGHGNAANNIDINGLGQAGLKIFRSQTLSDSAEISLGQSIGLQATNTYKLDHDPDLQRYVTLVGRTVGAASPASQYKYFVGVLDTDEVNAFSGPRGYIFITRGAIKRMHDESELAGVLAHEVGHVALQHGLKAVKNANFWGGITDAAAAGDQRIAAFKGAFGTCLNLVFVNGYSREQEDEADAEAVKYTIATGYDPHGLPRFLQRIEKEQGGPKLFPTHPGIKDRIKLIDGEIAKAGSPTGATLADRFQASVVIR
ncbi:MAG TPA: M48 family metalloprotease, partial [Tepidisphaeraceae bacterium]|jgi:predicted Zn-dependent protease|nr:M48 family metalloprotease [Tepidisphaeraceae bacterium]